MHRLTRKAIQQQALQVMRAERGVLKYRAIAWGILFDGDGNRAIYVWQREMVRHIATRCAIPAKLLEGMDITTVQWHNEPYAKEYHFKYIF